MPEKDFYQVSLKLILKNCQEEILILKSAKAGFCFGFYDLPGGRIDENEFKVEFLDILKRELTEEVGQLEVEIIDKPVVLGRAESRNTQANGKKLHVLYVIFEGIYHSGEVTVSDEHSEYKWVNLKNIKLEDYFVDGILDAIKKYLN